MGAAEVSASLWDTNQPTEEQEIIAIVHGGKDRFVLIEFPDVPEGESTRVDVRSTGITPQSLVTILRTLADGIEANAPREE